MASVEIAAAGVKKGDFSGDGLIFKLERTVGTGEKVLNERICAARTKMGPFGYAAGGLILRSGIFEKGLEFFLFPAVNTEELLALSIFILNDEL